MSEDKKAFMFDKEKNSKELNIGSDIYMRIVEKSIAQTEQDISDLEKSTAENDFEKTASISHRLKGTFDNMRLSQMAQAARTMNDLAKNKTDMEKIKALLGEFKDYFEQLKKEAGLTS